MISKNKEKIILLFLLFTVLSLSISKIDGVVGWGDDFAAYISEGIAMSEGKLQEQSYINYYYHPSPLPLEACNNELVYSWGYPLALSIIYDIFGYDASNIIYYKIPTLLALSVLTVIFYYFIKQYTKSRIALFSSILFFSYIPFYYFHQIIYSDIYFLPFLLLCFILSNKWLYEKHQLKKLFWGVGLGIILFYTREIRTNGILVLFCIIIQQLIDFISSCEWKKNNERNVIVFWFFQLIPYIFYICLSFIFEHFIFLPVTQTKSDVSFCTKGIFLNNCSYYLSLLNKWASSIFDYSIINPVAGLIKKIFPSFSINYQLVNIFVLIIFWSIVFLGLIKGLRKNNVHLFVYLVVYFIGVSLLPYLQGERYIFPIYPIVFLFFTIGLFHLLTLFKKNDNRNFILDKYLFVTVTTMVSILSVASIIYSSYSYQERIDTESIDNAYSTNAIELYDYINNEIPIDKIIAFGKPRALYLNTSHLSFAPNVNNHNISEADYYVLPYFEYDRIIAEDPYAFSSWSEIFSNEYHMILKKTT